MRFHVLPLLIVSMMFASQQQCDGEERIAVGSKAPGFTLQDQNDKPRTLDELLKDRPVALVFHRSADW